MSEKSELMRKFIDFSKEESELSRFIKKNAKNIPLEEVRKVTSGIKGKMSDVVIRIRHEDDLSVSYFLAGAHFFFDFIDFLEFGL